MPDNWTPDPKACLGSITFDACETCAWKDAVRIEHDPCKPRDCAKGVKAWVSAGGYVYCEPYEPRKDGGE